MNPWVPLAATLAWNYRQHRHGRPTICSTTRHMLPPLAAVAGWVALSGWILPHLLNGYPKET